MAKDDRTNVLKEILSSERDYVEGLKHIVEVDHVAQTDLESVNIDPSPHSVSQLNFAFAIIV